MEGDGRRQQGLQQPGRIHLHPISRHCSRLGPQQQLPRGQQGREGQGAACKPDGWTRVRLAVPAAPLARACCGGWCAAPHCLLLLLPLLGCNAAAAVPPPHTQTRAWACTRPSSLSQHTRALFEPPPFEPSKLSVSYRIDSSAGVGGTSSEGGVLLPPSASAPPPRRYTLTHNDLTGALHLTVDIDFNYSQISGFYNKLLRDEVTAEWQFDPDLGPSLHIYCYVSGEERWLAPAQLRNYIFRREIPLVGRGGGGGRREAQCGHIEATQPHAREGGAGSVSSAGSSSSSGSSTRRKASVLQKGGQGGVLAACAVLAARASVRARL